MRLAKKTKFLVGDKVTHRQHPRVVFTVTAVTTSGHVKITHPFSDVKSARAGHLDLHTRKV